MAFNNVNLEKVPARYIELSNINRNLLIDGNNAIEEGTQTKYEVIGIENAIKGDLLVTSENPYELTYRNKLFKFLGFCGKYQVVKRHKLVEIVEKLIDDTYVDGRVWVFHAADDQFYGSYDIELFLRKK